MGSPLGDNDLKTPEMKRYLFEALISHNPDLLFLQELDNITETSSVSEKYCFESKKNLGILFKKNKFKKINELTFETNEFSLDRILCVELEDTIQKMRILCICVHAPLRNHATGGIWHHKKTKFLKHVESILENKIYQNKYDAIILAGDFNCNFYIQCKDGRTLLNSKKNVFLLIDTSHFGPK